MKTTKLLAAILFALLTAQAAFAFYCPATGRWLSRDPNGEPGFETLRAASAVTRVGQSINPASLPPGRWINRDPIVETKEPNRYDFVGNNPVSHLDYLGLLSASGGTAHTSIIEHDNYISFAITCPSGTIAQNFSPDYTGALSGLEGLGLDNDMLSDAFQGNFNGASDLGGLVPNPQTPNCFGNPVTVNAYMRTRLSNQIYLNLLHNMFYSVDGFPALDSSQTVGAYTAGTIMNYECTKCCINKRHGSGL